MMSHSSANDSRSSFGIAAPASCIARVAAHRRLDVEAQDLARPKHRVELATQYFLRLSTQQLEDAAAERVVALHALHAGLARAIPRAHAILAIDDVQSERERVEDLLREMILRHRVLEMRTRKRRGGGGLLGCISCARQ